GRRCLSAGVCADPVCGGGLFGFVQPHLSAGPRLWGQYCRRHCRRAGGKQPGAAGVPGTWTGGRGGVLSCRVVGGGGGRRADGQEPRTADGVASPVAGLDRAPIAVPATTA